MCANRHQHLHWVDTEHIGDVQNIRELSEVHWEANRGTLEVLSTLEDYPKNVRGGAITDYIAGYSIHYGL